MMGQMEWCAPFMQLGTAMVHSFGVLAPSKLLSELKLLSHWLQDRLTNFDGFAEGLRVWSQKVSNRFVQIPLKSERECLEQVFNYNHLQPFISVQVSTWTFGLQLFISRFV